MQADGDRLLLSAASPAPALHVCTSPTRLHRSSVPSPTGTVLYLAG